MYATNQILPPGRYIHDRTELVKHFGAIWGSDVHKTVVWISSLAELCDSTTTCFFSLLTD